MSSTLDLSKLPAGECVGKLLTAFDTLAADGVMEVTLPADAESAVLEGIQKQLWGAFDWYPLERSGTLSRVVVHRLTAPKPRRSIREFMGYDHQRCDALYASMENAAHEGKLVEARELFAAFLLGMEHHFTMEEKGFFPAFEERTGMRQGPTMVMRMEHEQMRGILRQMAQAMAADNLDGVLRGGGTLLLVMQQHNVKEEQMLYPMGDMHMGEVDPLLQTMQRIR